MGFLSWWQDNKEEESASQMDLLNQAQELPPQRKRVDGATVNRRFNKAIKDSGGSETVYGRAVQAETRELFDCDVRQLYQETGGKRGNRSTLPIEAQEAYIVNETLSAHRLNESRDNDFSNTQEETDARIVETVGHTAHNVRKWLPW